MNKRVIPVPAWVMAGLSFVVVFIGLGVLMTRSWGRGPGPEVLIAAALALVSAAFVVLVGYVYGDAKRRGMRHVMWMWLAILVPNGIGIILYFILREPIPNYCTKCGSPARHGYAFCPRCGTGMAAACPQCHRVMEAGWAHCAYCGARL